VFGLPFTTVIELIELDLKYTTLPSGCGTDTVILPCRFAPPLLYFMPTVNDPLPPGPTTPLYKPADVDRPAYAPAPVVSFVAAGLATTTVAVLSSVACASLS